MKILWVVNIMLPVIARQLGKEYSEREGWLSGLFGEFMKETEKGDWELAVAYPVPPDKNTGSMPSGIPEVLDIKNIKCYSFIGDLSHPERYDKAAEERLSRIIGEVKPDILHIFGTEFPHCLAAVRAFHNPSRTLIGIQGLCGRIAEDYTADLPVTAVNRRTFRDIIRKDSIPEQREKFLQRGRNEEEAIRGVSHITGRTAFDREETGRINPSRIYHAMNETMRPQFYEGRWALSEACPHSIFAGQGDYPIKGLHFLLRAAGMLREEYPDLRIFVAGNDILHMDRLRENSGGWKARLTDGLKRPAYGEYLCSIIREEGLLSHVRVLGRLSAEEMKERYLKSALYVCPSYIENSPNTVSEAMLLGMPVIASKSGGIPDLISEREGFLYPRGDEKALADRIRTVFRMEDQKDPELGKRCGAAIERAHSAHDGTRNYGRLLEIYGEIL